jgi:hypothetical protein
MSATIAGALVGGALGAFGTKPIVPNLPTISPDQIQIDTAKGNTSALPDITKLGAAVNTFNQSQLTQMLNTALPGGVAQIQGNITSLLKGELPPDVQQAIQRSAAARAVGSGVNGSQFARNLEARDLGLTSLQLTEQGINYAQKWLEQATPKAFDVTSMFFTPQQRLGFALEDRAQQFNRNMIAAGVAAAPDPNAAQLGQGFDNFFKTFASIGTGALGGGGVSSVGPAAGGTGGFNGNAGYGGGSTGAGSYTGFGGTDEFGAYGN